MKCKCCSSCRTGKDYIENLKGTKVDHSPYHFLCVALTIAAVVAFFVRDIAEDGEQFIYYTPHKGHLQRPPAAFLTAVEFSQEEVRDKKKDLAWQMDYSCEASNNDVIFSFQYVRSTYTNKTYNDHIFMLCHTHLCLANAEIIHESEDKILCTEEYAGELRKKERGVNITIKAIHVQKWQTIEYETQNELESCAIGHAVEMLNSVW